MRAGRLYNGASPERPGESLRSFQVKDDMQTKFGTIYGPEEIAAVTEVIRAGAPTNDAKVRAFEEAFARYCGVKWAIAVTSGTTALNLGCVAGGVRPGDEVLVPAITWIATANAAALQGARIGFVDIDPKTYNMDPKDLRKKITDRTKMVIPVDLYGQPCDMDRIMRIARNNDILVMTDCAHSPGAEYRGRKTGSLGDIGAFSFHQQKNMSTLGEGGMVTTDDETIYKSAKMFRNHGREEHSHEFSMVGHNYRMTDVQGAVGLVQLAKLDSFNEKRIANATLLTDLLADVRGIVTPYVQRDVKHVFHLYNILVDEKRLGLSRDQFVEKLAADYGILAGTHYAPIHLAPIYRERGSKPGDCPVAERIGRMNFTLPTHPRLTEGNVRYMAKAVREIAGS